MSIRTRSSLIAMLGVGLLPRAYGQATVTLLDTSGDVGVDPSVGIAAGTALIAYYDATNRDLKAAHCADAACTGALLSTVDSAGDVGRFAALAVGADGLGVISYFDETQPALKVAHCSNVDCSQAALGVVDAGAVVLGQTSIAIGADGLPLIAYVRRTGTAAELAAAHCASVTCSSATVTPLRELADTGSTFRFDTAIAVGVDGLGLISYIPQRPAPPGTPIGMAHCANTACDGVTPGPPPARRAPEGALTQFLSRPSLLIGADGLGLVSYRRDVVFNPPNDIFEFRLRHCADTACSAFTSDVPVPSTVNQGINAPLAMGADGKPWFVRLRNERVRIARCDDASCLTWSESCATVAGGTLALSLALGADAEPLTAFHAKAASDLGIVHGSGPCLPSAASIADLQIVEGNQPTYGFAQVRLDVPTDVEATVEYSTVPGTAVPGIDYVPVSGTLTFHAGSASGSPLVVNALGDPFDEDDEQYQVVLQNAAGITVADGTGVVTIVDDDPEPLLGVEGCATVEGTGTTTPCEFTLSLDVPSGRTVSVPYATHDETASEGSDYTAVSGVITLDAGNATQALPVAVTGDSIVELDETFRLELGTALNATVVASQAQGVILDDDAPPLSSLELTHGSTVNADLSAQGGPTADVDVYRLAQPPFTSWEVVVDGVSGDVAPGLLLERLGADNATVLEAATPVGTGGAVSLRFDNRVGAPVLSQHLRVRSTGCGTDCGADDAYRLRVFETTARLARFNNAGSQLTVLLLQNPTAAPVSTAIDFWSEAGARLATRTAVLPPLGMIVLETWAIPALDQASGSVTVSNDAPYGSLAGKAVALEPATGFSFDSPLEYRPR